MECKDRHRASMLRLPTSVLADGDGYARKPSLRVWHPSSVRGLISTSSVRLSRLISNDSSDLQECCRYSLKLAAHYTRGPLEKVVRNRALDRGAIDLRLIWRL